MLTSGSTRCEQKSLEFFSLKEVQLSFFSISFHSKIFFAILGHVVLHPPSNLTTVYVGDGDVYFYWSPPQNYRTHNPKPLLETEVSKIHNIDHVHFSDSGTWHDEEFGTGTYNSDKYWALDFFSDLRHLHKKFRGIGNSDSQSDHDLITPSNKTVEEHIVQSNLTEEQMDKVRQHYASKNISDVPNWFQKTTVPKEHAGIMFYTVFWQEMINGTGKKKLLVIGE